MTTFILGNIIGFMVFFVSIIAPTIFKIFNAQQAGKFLRLFFPKYYFFGAFISVLGLFSSIYEQSLILIISFAFLIFTFLFLRQILTPAINNAKDMNLIKKFEKLHKCSVILNCMQIFLCFFLFLNSQIMHYEL